VSWLNGTLADFLRPMGLPAPDFESDPVVKLSFERRGTLYLERLEDAVRIYLARRHGRLSFAQLRRSLELCGPDERPSFEMHVGLDGDDNLVFLTCLPAVDFIPSTLSKALAELERFHDRVAREV
jgi:type III secretion system chaperone SycN